MLHTAKIRFHHLGPIARQLQAQMINTLHSAEPVYQALEDRAAELVEMNIDQPVTVESCRASESKSGRPEYLTLKLTDFVITSAED